MGRLGLLPVNNTGITVLMGRLGPLPVSNTGITITVLMGRHGPLPVTLLQPLTVTLLRLKVLTSYSNYCK